MARKKGKPSGYIKHDDFHVVFSVEHLRERLALFAGLLPRRPIRKDLACYHIDVRDDGTATVSATDLENRLRLNLEVLRRYGHGTLMVEHHALNMILRTYPAPTIQFGFDVTPVGAKDKGAVEVPAQGDKVRLVLPGADPGTQLPTPVPGSLSTSGWFVRGSDLARAIERTAFATDTTNGRFALGGVVLIFPEAGDRLEIVATDGRRLARVSLPVRRHGEPERLWHPGVKTDPALGAPILPVRMLPIVRKLADAEGDRAVGLAVLPGKLKDLKGKEYAGGQVQVVTRDAVLTTLVPTGRFPRYRDVYPKSAPIAEVHFADAEHLRDLLAAAASATDSESKAAEIVIASEMLMISVRSETKGKMDLSLPVPGSIGQATFKLDAYWFREFLDVARGEPLVVKVYGSDQAIICQAGPCYELVQMPLSERQYVPPQKPARIEPPKPEKGDDDAKDDGKGDSPKPSPEPEPVAPVAAETNGHHKNGKAKVARNGKD